MRRSILMVGMLALLGCEGLESEGAPGTAAAVAPATAPAAATAASEMHVAPRVDRFALLPAAPVLGGDIQPESWARTAEPALPGAGAEVRSHFDPQQVRAVEAYRLQAAAQAGAQ